MPRKRPSIKAEEIREAARHGRDYWSRHARERLAERNISRTRALQVIISGRIIERNYDAKPFPTCVFMGVVDNDRPPLCVCVAYDRERALIEVVTVYWHKHT